MSDQQDRLEAIRKLLTSEDYSIIELYEAIEFCVGVVEAADKLAKAVSVGHNYLGRPIQPQGGGGTAEAHDPKCHLCVALAHFEEGRRG